MAVLGGGLDPDRWVHTIDSDGAVVAQIVRTDGRLAVDQRIRRSVEPYRINWRLGLENLSDEPITEPELADLRLSIGPGLGQYPADGMGIAGGLYTFVEALVRQGGHIERFRADPNGSRQWPAADGVLEWFGLHSRYFALVLRPVGQGSIEGLLARTPAPGVDQSVPAELLPVLIATPALRALAPGERLEFEFLIFSGPKSSAALSAGAGGFEGLMFVGLWRWMRGLCRALLGVLNWIHQWIPSWGLAIMLLAVLVRLALYPLASRAMASQRAFVEVQQSIGPALKQIKQRYRGEEQSERILALYAQHGVSPLAGLKPLGIVLLQIPIFIALFHVLGQAFELRQAPFLWIETLSEPDRLFALGAELPFFGAHFNALPVIMAVTTLMTLKLSPAPAADAAAKRRQSIFLVGMAVGFFLLFYSFPSGLVLYWTTANVLHIVQSRVPGPGARPAHGP